MKRNRKLVQWIPSAMFGLLTCWPGTGFAVGDLILNTFDSTNEVTATDNNWSGGSLYWDPNVDAGGTPNKGALHVTCNYTDQGNNWQETQIGRNIPWNNGNYINLSPYVYIEMDIKPDVSNSYPATDGNWCEFNPVIQQWDWTSLPSTRLLGTNWTHIKTALTPAITLAHLVCDFHRTYNAYPTNTISYWIDNIKLTVPPSPPPKMSIKPAGTPGLRIFASNPSDTYQRQLIRTVTGSYSWDSATAQSNTVTYSMNIVDFPASNYNGFIAQMFLVSSANSNMLYGPADTSIDWNSGSVIYFTIQRLNNGAAVADFRYKTNEWGGQTMAFNDQPGGQYGTNGWPVGHLTGLICSTGPLGTWSLSVSNNTDFTLRAPNGSSTNFSISAQEAALFVDPLYAYFGIQPNGTNSTDYSRIGQSAAFSRIRIDGAAMSVDDTFSTGSLDTLTWAKNAANPAGVQVVPQDAAFWLSWTTPDPGFTNIWCSSDISTPFSGWAELTTSPQSSWINLLDQRTALLSWSGLSAVLPDPTNHVYFRLWKVEGGP